MRVLLLISLFALPAAALAQDYNPARAAAAATQQSLDEALANRDLQAQREAAKPKPAPLIDGSRWAAPYWTRGRLVPIAGAPSRPWLKYDVAAQQLLTRTADEAPQLVDTNPLREFSVGDSLLGTRRTFRRYLRARAADPALRTVFFEVCYDAGRSALLRQRLYTFFPKEPGTTVRRGAQRETIVFFVADAAHTLPPVTLTPEAILAALAPTHRAALAAYARRQQLRLDREPDIIRLLAYYDTM